MSDTWGYENNDNGDLDNTNELSGPKALRDAYKAQQEMLKQIQQELQAERDARTKEKLSTVFESLGVPGAADLYRGDADPQKAKEWVQSMQTVFGGGNVQGSTPQNADSTPALSEAQAEQYQRMTEAGQQGAPLGNMDAAFAAVGDANDTKALIAAFKRATQMG